jgi:hypothetical protein
MSYSDLYFVVRGRIAANEKQDKAHWLRTCYLVASIAGMMGSQVNPTDLMPFDEYRTPEPPPVPESDWKRLDELIEKFEKENGRS